MAMCLVCQQVKFKHKRPRGQLQTLEIPVWKWEDIACDFLVGLAKIERNHDVIWVVIDNLENQLI